MSLNTSENFDDSNCSLDDSDVEELSLLIKRAKALQPKAAATPARSNPTADLRRRVAARKQRLQEEAIKRQEEAEAAEAEAAATAPASAAPVAATPARTSGLGAMTWGIVLVVGSMAAGYFFREQLKDVARRLLQERADD